MGISNHYLPIRLSGAPVKKRPDSIYRDFGGFKCRLKTPQPKLTLKKSTKAMTHQILPFLKDWMRSEKDQECISAQLVSADYTT